MTKKEAIYCMKSYLPDDNLEHCINCPYYGCNKINDHLRVCQSSEAHRMAIEALKQEPILDKIRAEISDYGSLWVEYKIEGHSDRDIEKIVEDVLKQAKQQVLDVIDKYKESEDKE